MKKILLAIAAITAVTLVFASSKLLEAQKDIIDTPVTTITQTDVNTTQEVSKDTPVVIVEKSPQKIEEKITDVENVIVVKKEVLPNKTIQVPLTLTQKHDKEVNIKIVHIQTELKRKDEQRIVQTELREARLKKLDEDLEEKSKQRD